MNGAKTVAMRGVAETVSEESGGIVADCGLYIARVMVYI